MEGKQVPWWRKALSIALGGIRSGFGLFSRKPRNIDEIEPKTIAGHEEIREEAELTEHSPELNSIEAEEPIALEAEDASDLEVVALQQSTTMAKPAIEVQSEKASVQEPEVAIEAPVAESEPEPDPKREAEPQSDVMALPEEGTLEPELGEAIASPEPESMVEPESEPATEVAAEVTQPEEEAPSEQVRELDVAVSNMVVDAEEAEAPAVVPESTIETSGAADDAEQDKAQLNASEQDVAAHELSVYEPPVEPAIEDGFEQVTKQQVTVENVSVDEVAPQSVSPVPEELIESQTQAADESKELPVESAATGAADLVAEEIVSEAAEPADEEFAEQRTTIGQSTEPIAEDVDTQTADQAIEKSMELNQPNSENDAEHDETPTAASPGAAAEEPAKVLEAPAEEPVNVDEPAALAADIAVSQHPSKPFIKLEAKEGEPNASPFSVIVSQVYDGPLDLLLDLIRKQDIDIYDIPIARITAQFLAYVNQLKASDVDVAGEFIYTASLLIHIKSKMLLPRAPSGPDDAAEDPRRELVERLLEHERFKNAAQMLQQKQMLEAATWTNPGVREFKEDASAEPEIAADTVDLVRVFREILERARNRPILNVEEDSVTVGQMIQFLSRRLSMEDNPIALRKLLSHSRSERALIAMFLALLELVRLQAILLRQDLAFSEIFIKKHSNFESLITESVAHDDWR